MIDARYRAIETEARAGLIAEGVGERDIELRRSAGMRYLGQSWELIVDLRSGHRYGRQSSSPALRRGS